MVTIGVPYMGTKRQLAGVVADLVADCSPGPFLDLFAGMCSVGSAVGTRRQVWSNDLQRFATLIAKAHFCSHSSRPDSVRLAELLHKTYQISRLQLSERFQTYILSERGLLKTEDAIGLRAFFHDCITQAQASSQADHNSAYDVLTTRFGGSYFSFEQTIGMDSIRSALDAALSDALISDEDHQWGLVALCIAASKCSTTTGHFAQPLTPKPSNMKKFSSQRRRVIWDEWVGAAQQLDAVGSTRWRRKNIAFTSDANDLLRTFETRSPRPKVVYADPPYTKDQYSRFYHLYETLIVYDRPNATGRGLYRADRNSSTFSQRKHVAEAIEVLAHSCASIRADLILSYPTNGLLDHSGERIPQILRSAYGKPIDVIHIPHSHSTMGGSKGVGRSDVIEALYRVRN